MEHLLKIEEQYLRNLIDGRKKCEVRLNDRDYQVGDILSFYDDDLNDSGDYRNFEITHIHSGVGLTDNYVCLSVKIV